jgi:hypothetical protein
MLAVSEAIENDLMEGKECRLSDRMDALLLRPAGLVG